jgi:hypothetical protein
MAQKARPLLFYVHVFSHLMQLLPFLCHVTHDPLVQFKLLYHMRIIDVRNVRIRIILHQISITPNNSLFLLCVRKVARLLRFLIIRYHR